jgi:glutamyl-tRNA synthetase/glutamyl-Q tRNA(Asp) synthetase
MVTPLLTRFAPSPTGHLHLGHVVNAMYVWGWARAAGGKVLLRIEDHDRQRSRPEFERSILEDLEWLGFIPDAPLVRQSERRERYQEELDRLRARGLAYVCSCSRRDLALTIPDLPGEEMRYPGTCRAKGLEWHKGLSWRIRLEPGSVEFVDVRLGRQVQAPCDQCGDLQAMDRLGNWTYQFAVTVDDHRQGITLVVRGEDLLPSTGRQVVLSRLLGREHPPTFLHHPLILNPGGEKLSKARRDTGIRELRAQGLTAEAVLGKAAYGVGMISGDREMSREELVEIFRKTLAAD